MDFFLLSRLSGFDAFFDEFGGRGRFFFGEGEEVDAVDGAGWEAEFAAYALVSDDGVHLLVAAKYGIHRAGVYTFSATNTFWLANSDKILLWHYLTLEPAGAAASGVTSQSSGPLWLATITMPSDMPKRILRGSRFATTTTLLPINCSG